MQSSLYGESTLPSHLHTSCFLLLEIISEFEDLGGSQDEPVKSHVTSGPCGGQYLLFYMTIPVPHFLI